MVFLVSSCVSHDFPQANTCDVRNPVDDLPWLKAKVAELNNSEFSRKYWYITQATYNLETVFIIKNCCPNCLTLPPPVHACNGQVLFDGADEQFDDIQAERLIWKSTEYACTF